MIELAGLRLHKRQSLTRDDVHAGNCGQQLHGLVAVCQLCQTQVEFINLPAFVEGGLTLLLSHSPKAEKDVGTIAQV